MTRPMIIPTDGGLRPGDAKWRPMQDWLTANRFDITHIPVDALIVIRDGSCLGVDHWSFDTEGRLVIDHETGVPPRHVEWHPLIQQPPAILLPREAR